MLKILLLLLLPDVCTACNWGKMWPDEPPVYYCPCVDLFPGSTSSRSYIESSSPCPVLNDSTLPPVLAIIRRLVTNPAVLNVKTLWTYLRMIRLA